MFIGYLRNNFETACESLINNNILFDIELLKKTYETHPQYCFAAYKDEKIVGVISACIFEKHIYINVLEVLDEYKDVLKRLISLLIKNINSENLFFLVNENLYKELESFEFKEYCDFVRYIHSGEAVAFNFSNSLAKQVSENDYVNVSKQIDKTTFNQDRSEYLSKNCTFSNSLNLATKSGFLHSYVVNKRYIRISPWLIKDEAFLDAEKLLRGVLYYRGLKKLFAYAPKDVEEITALYESYKFKKESTYKLLYMGEKPILKLDCIYAI